MPWYFFSVLYFIALHQITLVIKVIVMKPQEILIQVVEPYIILYFLMNLQLETTSH